MGNAQDAYRAMLRDEIAPALRALGLRGSGSRFSFADPASWALLGFQSSRYNTDQAMRFTVNLSAVPKHVWESRRREQPHLPVRPTPGTYYGEFVWSRRLGHLMPVDKDVWWDLDGEHDPKVAASGVVAAIGAYGLPALRQQL